MTEEKGEYRTGIDERYLSYPPQVGPGLAPAAVTPITLPLYSLPLAPLPADAAWALVEIMGHDRIAGQLAEETIAGVKLLRVDVPATARLPGYTRYLAGAAIFSINPCSPATGQHLVDQLQARPLPDDLYEGTATDDTERDGDGDDDYDAD